MSRFGNTVKEGLTRFLIAASGEGKEYLAEQDRQRELRRWQETKGLGVEYFNGAPLEPGPIGIKRGEN